MLNTREVKIGKRVYWLDPDDGLCSGWGKIIKIKNDDTDADPSIDDETIITLRKEDGGEVETTIMELSIETGNNEIT